MFSRRTLCGVFVYPTMTKYYYNDANGRTHGPVDQKQCEQLVEKGIIGDNTPMMSNTGIRGTARQFFPDADMTPSILLSIEATLLSIRRIGIVIVFLLLIPWLLVLLAFLGSMPR
jgi:hypothetical protein